MAISTNTFSTADIQYLHIYNIYTFSTAEAKNAEQGAAGGVPNTVLWEINAWERKMKRFETMEAQLNMPAVQVSKGSFRPA